MECAAKPDTESHHCELLEEALWPGEVVDEKEGPCWNESENKKEEAQRPFEEKIFPTFPTISCLKLFSTECVVLIIAGHKILQGRTEERPCSLIGRTPFYLRRPMLPLDELNEGLGDGAGAER